MPTNIKRFMRKHPPASALGYSFEQVSEMLGDRLEEFQKWMDRQTVGVDDDGKVAYYPYDVWRFYENNAHKDWWD